MRRLSVHWGGVEDGDLYRLGRVYATLGSIFALASSGRMGGVHYEPTRVDTECRRETAIEYGVVVGERGWVHDGDRDEGRG